MRQSSITSLLVLASASMIAGCDGGVSAKKVPESPVSTAPRHGLGSGVTVTHRIDGVPRPNVATPITLQFDGVSSAEGTTVTFASEGDATLADAQPRKFVPGETASATVLLTPHSEGPCYLNVTTVQGGVFSVVSIRVQVGERREALKAQGEVKTTPGGESLIHMPSK